MKRNCLSDRSQCGQSLVLGMVLAGLLSLALLRYFQVGQVAGARVRQLHALDAAAYSGALAQARALNMLAYINRSQVAHQVALAHLVTLSSWAAFGETEAARLLRGNPPSYLIGMQFGPAHAAAYRAAARASGLGGLSGRHGVLAAAHAEHERIVHDVLAATQQSIVQRLSAYRKQAMLDMLALSYPEMPAAGLNIVLESDTLPGYVRRLRGGGKSADGLRSLVLSAAAHYRFLASRQATARNPWLVQPGCPHLRHELRRQGATILNGRGVWQSVDTQSFHALRALRKVVCYYREYPMAWAWTPTGNSRFMMGETVNHHLGRSGNELWKVIRTVTSALVPGAQGNRAADGRARLHQHRWPARGLTDYFDIMPGRGVAPMSFSVSMKQKGPMGTIINTRSAAEAFFAHPPALGITQPVRAQLFQPYWQARLSSPDEGPSALSSRPSVGRRPWQRPTAPSRLRTRRYRRAPRARQAGTVSRCTASLRQRGQAVTEAVVVLSLLIGLWMALGWLGRLQDIALSAQHSAGFVAFLSTRTLGPLVDRATAGTHFQGPAHHWRAADGTPLLEDRRQRTAMAPNKASGAVDVVLRWLRDPRYRHGDLDVGGTSGSSGLPGHFLADTDAIVATSRATVRHSPFQNVNAPRISRQVAIMRGAGHASDPAAIALRLAREPLWRRTSSRSVSAGRRIAHVMTAIDAGWKRPAPSFDWLSAWAGDLPRGVLPTRLSERHLGLRNLSTALKESSNDS